jgi:hypothetical protein
MPTKKKRDVTVSPSQLLAMDCRLNWDLGYRQGFRKRGITPAERLYMTPQKERHPGLMLEGFSEWAEERRTKIANSGDQAKMDDVVMAGEFLCRIYDEYWIESGLDKLDVLATEHTVKIPLVDPATGKPVKAFLNARLDGVVRDPRSGHLLVLEHKTYSRLDKADMERSHQFAIQILLARALCQQEGWGEKVIGVLYNGAKKPRYEGGQHHLPVKKFELADYFHRTTLLRTERQLQVVAERAFYQWKLFYKTRDLPIFPQPASMRCAMCDFSDVCLEMQRGGDWRYLLEQDYYQRGNEKRPEPEIEIE